jgi:hypothetical protein
LLFIVIVIYLASHHNYQVSCFSSSLSHEAQAPKCPNHTLTFASHRPHLLTLEPTRSQAVEEKRIFNIEMRPAAASSFASGENASFDHVCLMFGTESVQCKEDFFERAGKLDERLLKECNKNL